MVRPSYKRPGSLLRARLERNEDEGKALRQISLDLPRIFLQERLADDNGPRRETLRRVLVAHALAEPHIGYLQGMHA